MKHILLENSKKEQALRYWVNELAGKELEISLPYDYPKSTLSHVDAAEYVFNISEITAEMDRTETFRPHLIKMSTPLVILTAFTVLLYRYSGEHKLCVGVQGLSEKGTQTSAFPLILKTEFKDSFSAIEALINVKRNVKKSHVYQSPSFQEIIAKLGEETNQTTDPFINVMFEIGGFKASDSPLKADQSIHGKDRYVDLKLKVTDINDQPTCSFLYNEALFKKETIQRMAGHLTCLLTGMVANVNTPISHLPLLTAEEKQHLLFQDRHLSANFPIQASIDALFAEQAGLYPTHVALIYGQTQITYDELNKRANQIANYLREIGIKKEDLVAVCLKRSPDMIASFLGILKAGAAYVPIDLNYPEERVNYMLLDSKASYVITTAEMTKSLVLNNAKVICLDRDARMISRQSIQNPIPSQANQLAYVIYTSGSTGHPKGVMIEHTGVVRLVKHIDYANVGPEETFINLTAISFDVSVFEIYGALLNGGRLVLMPSDKPSFEEIIHEIRVNQVTSLCAIPGMLNILVEDYRDGLDSLRQILSAGEALPVWLAKKCLTHLNHCQLINAYGPSENSVYSTSYVVNNIEPHATSISIGRPIANDRVYILDAFKQPVPIGVIGELYLAGDGIARGYYQKDQLTEEVFISGKTGTINENNLYKTGDLARFTSDGHIDFIGRIDNQVKIRGIRVELGEIETAIGQMKGIRQTVVTVVRNKTDENDLVAYIVMNQGYSFDQNSLRSNLLNKLPEQLIPTFFIELDEIPTTPVGKIDRKLLPDPEAFSSTHHFIAPRNHVEAKMTHLWEDVLGIQPIGVTDHYFELGGSSLLAMQLFAKIEDEFKVRLPVSLIFQDDTIEKLTAHLKATDQSQIASPSLVPIQPEGTKIPLFCIHGGGGEVFIYRDLAIKLGKQQPLYGLRYVEDSHFKSQPSVELLAQKYIKEIREVQPAGPYALVGFCLGGAIAYDMAQKLIQQGEKVALLTILNFANPCVRPISIQEEMTYKKAVINNLRLLFKMPLRKRASFFIQKIKNAAQIAKSPPKNPEADHKLARNRRRLSRVVGSYKPKPYPGHVLLIRADDYQNVSQDNLGWEIASGGRLTVHHILSDHESLLKGTNVDMIADHLTGQLLKTEGRCRSLSHV